MTIKEHTINRTIDLTMEEGNVFFLIGLVNRLSKKVDKDSKAISKAIIKEMMAADYGNAVYVFNREFGDFYDIILPPNMSVKGVKDSYLKANLTQERIEEIYKK